MKLVTWNINSVRAREDRLLLWLEKERPDVLCLQETKVEDHQFPLESVRQAGYHAVVHGQKTYNGVAILSPHEATEVTRGMGAADDDPQARLIGAVVGGVRVLSAYFPNGRSVGTEEYAYKLEWMRRLRRYLDELAAPTEPLILAGDFNVCTHDDDAAHPEEWRASVLCHGASREALDEIRDWGLVDVFRRHHPQGGIFSWWDYRMLAFPKNDGLRIDHIFATETLARSCTAASVDRDERKKGKVGKPSDHAPVIAEFEL